MKKTKEKMQKVNIGDWYDVREIGKTINYAQEQKHVSGVEEILSILIEKYNSYDRDMKALKSKEQTNMDNMYLKWNKVYTYSLWCKWASVIMFVLDLFIDNIFILFFLLLGIVFFCVFGICQFILSKKYSKYWEGVKTESDRIYNKHFAQMETYYNRIDSLYLASLEPMQRDMILMRREMLKMEQRNQELLREQIKNQNKMEQQQREMQKIQGELLQIERQREERYKQSTRW